MASDNSHSNDSSKKRLHLVGVGVSHSIAPPMHNFICESLNKPWTFYATECPTIEDVTALFKSPDFAGAVVTMPYKKSIMPHLDSLDDLALKLGACNNVYITPDGKLRGTNTDWRGVNGCLLAADQRGVGKPALIIGAGGASRAAVYALAANLRCPTIYVINRDVKEVNDLIEDTRSLLSSLKSDETEGQPKIMHVQTLDQANSLTPPHYIVGTVPDFAPSTPEEHLITSILESFLTKTATTGVLLDMCFKPRVTRNIKLAKAHNWLTVEGTEIIGHQIQEQYRLWTKAPVGATVIDQKLSQDSWAVLRQAAEENSMINF